MPDYSSKLLSWPQATVKATIKQEAFHYLPLSTYPNYRIFFYNEDRLKLVLEQKVD